MKITLTNVRGFEGSHEISIRPITIIIGENSSGKTTLLAAISAVLNRDFPTTENLFNRSPFELGSFDTIATYRGGKYGRASSFSVGWTNDSPKRRESIIATFKSDAGVPRIDCLIVTGPDSQLKVSAADKRFDFELTFVPEKKPLRGKVSNEETEKIKFSADISGNRAFRMQDVVRYYFEGLDHKALSEKSSDRNAELSSSAFDALHRLSIGSSHVRPHATALAPLRTRPRRTYDELNEEFKPEGDHVPLVLARLLSEKEDGKELAALTQFGIDSGLFSKIDVKRLGRKPSDPFQVRVKMHGPDANLIDVGYGVSQSLPIVIDSIMAPEREVLLIQQPEVHLHPKAQAALGTFFVQMAESTSKQFVVETHSDYLIDRVRIEVAKGTISARKIQLLYLERRGLDVKVHELELDDLGNVKNAPANYRDFFFQEEMSLMSRAV